MQLIPQQGDKLHLLQLKFFVKHMISHVYTVCMGSRPGIIFSKSSQTIYPQHFDFP